MLSPVVRISRTSCVSTAQRSAFATFCCRRVGESFLMPTPKSPITAKLKTPAGVAGSGFVQKRLS